MQRGHQSRAVDTAGAMDEDRPVRRLRDRVDCASEAVGEAVEEEQVAQPAPLSPSPRCRGTARPTSAMRGGVEQRARGRARSARRRARLRGAGRRCARRRTAPPPASLVSDSSETSSARTTDAEAGLAPVLERQAAEVADVAATLPAEGALRLQLRRARSHCSVVDVAPSMRTSTRSPGEAEPAKLTVVFRLVRPRRSDGSVRLAPSTSTCSTRPTRSSLRSCAIRWTTSTSRSIRSRLSSSGI